MNKIKKLSLLSPFIIVLFVFLFGCAGTIIQDKPPENSLEKKGTESFLGASATFLYRNSIRGIWVQSDSLLTKTTIDLLIQRAQNGNLNTIFAHTFPSGQTLYNSQFAAKSDDIDSNFNPLAYLIQEAHSRGIKVHAWMTIGWLGQSGTQRIREEHPDWMMVSSDGTLADWINFTHPDYQKLIHNLVLELIDQYAIDGIHLDYLRYPQQPLSFDPLSIEAFEKYSHFSLTELAYPDLPAFGVFEINPIINPTTGIVLASFSNGVPAVIENSYGQGKVILLNWNASDRPVAFGAEVVNRSIDQLLSENGNLYLLNSATNAAEYGTIDFDRSMLWLSDLGWNASEIGEYQIDSLGAGSILILSNNHIVSQLTAMNLERFIRRGGNVIFIDGPTKSISIHEIQLILGMEGRGDYFFGPNMITSKIESPLTPVSQRLLTIDEYISRNEIFNQYRRESINDFIKNLYREIKAKNQKIELSVTVTSDLERAKNTDFFDWESWLEAGYVDFLVPRMYVNELVDLYSLSDEWEFALKDYSNIIFGLSVYRNGNNGNQLKTPEQLFSEQMLVWKRQISGFVLFDYDQMNDNQFVELGNFFPTRGNN